MYKTANIRYFKALYNWKGTIEELITKLIADVYNDINPPPTNVKEKLQIISSLRNIDPDPIYKDLGDNSAWIVSVNGRNKIYLNINHSEGRQLFSWAHEISHTFFPKKPEEEKIDGFWIDGENPEEEILCDFGANQIIFWNVNIADTTFHEDLLENVSKQTGASLEASSIFIAKSPDYRFGMALWSKKYKKGQCAEQQSLFNESPISPVYRIDYAIYSKSVFLPKNKSINKGEELLENAVSAKKLQKGDITIDPGNRGLFEFQTIAFPVHDQKVLTLLKKVN
ncbi:ImmA/IrrE family metallo-endopeptidase [Candidatus Dojkabacteria bacterium]|uniref:ImmA/IrrE family metallo-endopeptidase n=1 Tax=Candidatus Dojkabacteria bacterium TaxID=2099670 RepID=A0A955HYJ1_9BACT|nr:ImmA/IrrE family metallo-endopeptidase [Candidatus Dojkabacteria bacterium]